MEAPRRVLAPVDLSRRSERGVRYAAALADACDASLVLHVNVNLPERSALEDLSEAEGVSLDEATDLALRRIAERCAPGLDCTHLSTTADFPAEGVLGAARHEHADMIVMASGGRGGVKRLVLGSVAEDVARRSTVPVVIVPGSSE